MDQKVQQQLLDKSSQFLTQASHMLGQTAGHVYGVLVRQQVIDGIATIISLILFLILIGWPLKYTFERLWQWKEASDEDAVAPVICMIFIPAGIIIAALLITSTLQTSIEQILNPEYFAIKFIFDSVKPN